ATAGAHVKVDTADGDGVVREVPLVVETADGRFVPSLSLAAVLAYRDAQLQPVFGDRGVQAGGLVVPTESGQRMRLNFAEGLSGRIGSKTLVSARDLYCASPPTDISPEKLTEYCETAGAADPSQCADKIAFIGAPAESARDIVDTQRS